MYRCDRCLVLLLGATLELVDNAVGHGSALAISASTPAPELSERVSAGFQTERTPRRGIRPDDQAKPRDRQVGRSCCRGVVGAQRPILQFRLPLPLRLPFGAVPKPVT